MAKQLTGQKNVPSSRAEANVFFYYSDYYLAECKFTPKKGGTESLFVPHELACNFVLWPSIFLDDSQFSMWDTIPS